MAHESPPQMDWLDAVLPSTPPFRARLSEHSDVIVWHVRVVLQPWVAPSGTLLPTRKDTYGWKPQVRSSDPELGRSVGEVELAQRLRTAGLQAYWTDNFGSAPSHWHEWIRRGKALPAFLLEIDRRIRMHPLMRPFPRGGWPDVVAWAGGEDDWYCLEYKGPSAANPRRQDRVQASQDAWFRAALDLQLVSEQKYAVAKWEPDAESVKLLELQRQWQAAARI